MWPAIQEFGLKRQWLLLNTLKKGVGRNGVCSLLSTQLSMACNYISNRPEGILFYNFGYRKEDTFKILGIWRGQLVLEGLLSPGMASMGHASKVTLHQVSEELPESELVAAGR
jgi:hypothetical protein